MAMRIQCELMQVPEAAQLPTGAGRKAKSSSPPIGSISQLWVQQGKSTAAGLTIICEMEYLADQDVAKQFRVHIATAGNAAHSVSIEQLRRCQKRGDAQGTGWFHLQVGQRE